jgi:hypothetical protein
MTLESELGARGSHLTRHVGLNDPAADHAVGALGQRRRQVVFQFPDLVAAEPESGAVVPLDEQPGSAEICRQARHLFQWRRQVRELDTWKSGKTSGRCAAIRSW